MNLPTLLNKTLPCFPCCNDEHKHPMTPHGFKDATTDPDKFTYFLNGRKDFLFGVPTGETTGFDVLDIDPDGFEWASIQTIPATCTHKTRRGGTHYLFNHSPGLRNSASKISLGVDVRSTGGYIIWWPFQNLQTFNEEILADWPQHILNMTKSHIRQTSSMGTPDSAPSVSDFIKNPNRIWISYKECERLLLNKRPGEAEVLFGVSQGCPSSKGWSFLEHPYMGKTEKTFSRESLFALQAAAQALLELSNTEVGDRNQTLNSCAFGLGRLLARGWIRFDTVVRALWYGAVNCRLIESDGLQSTISTICSGLSAGLENPYPDLVVWRKK